MKRIFLKFRNRIVNIFRNAYISVLRIRFSSLCRKGFTLITNNCIGGVLYHDLQMQFKSPTINLFFSTEDFLLFANDLMGYINGELTEKKDSSKNFPVGILDNGKNKIELNFLHYSSFDEAKSKWAQRKERIVWNSIFVIFEFNEIDNISELDFAKVYSYFSNIPFKKIMITKNPYFRGYKDVLYSRKCLIGDLCYYKNDNSIKRNIYHTKLLNHL